MSQKKIETLSIEVNSPTGIKFEDLLLSEDFDGKEQRLHGKDVSLRVIDKDAIKKTIVGIVETSRKSNVPAKKDHIKKVISPIGLANSESLVYANVFIYDIERKIIMYEVNKNGCYIDHFILFFYKCSKDKNCVLKDYGLKFTSLLKKDEYLRLQRFDYIKSVQIQVAHPSEITLEHKDKNGAIGQMISAASGLGSTDVFAKFNVTSRDRNEGLLNKSFDDLIQQAKSILQSEKNHNIKKLLISGYETDGDNPNKLEPIDLVADRYIKFIDLNEPRVNTDLLESPRTFAIKSLHTECCDDFDEIIGKK